MFSFRLLSPACCPSVCPVLYSRPKEEHLSYRQKCYSRNTLYDKPGVRAEQARVHLRTCRLPENGTKSSSALLLSLGLLESSRALIPLEANPANQNLRSWLVWIGILEFLTEHLKTSFFFKKVLDTLSYTNCDLMAIITSNVGIHPGFSLFWNHVASLLLEFKRL